MGPVSGLLNLLGWLLSGLGDIIAFIPIPL
jgi:hypothetical protein